MRYGSLIIFALLCGCSEVSGVMEGVFQKKDPPLGTQAETGAPLAAPLAVEAVPEPTEAVETAVAEPAPAPGGNSRAVTVAALGDPAKPGAWMETPLVTKEQSGQVLFGDKGVNVTLIPSGGAATGGSSLSLDAMKALGLPLADLTEVEVVF